MSDLLVIVPSRGRPANIARLYRAWADTNATATLMVCVDDDDPLLADYRRLDHPGLLHVAPPAGSIVPILNREAVAAARTGWPYVGFMGDDHIPRTPAWDKTMVDTLCELGTGVAYGNDLFQGERIPTAVFLTADIVAALGYMAPPQFQHLFLDDTWKAWGDGIGRCRYLPDVVIEHCHPQAGKTDWDDGYRRVNGGDVWGRDGQAWEQYKAGQLPGDLVKLRGLL